MPYVVLKGLHVGAVSLWLAGMLLTAVALASIQPGKTLPALAETRFLDLVRTVNRFLTTPAMLASWALGIGLGMAGRWFGAPWLLVKLIVVVALSALHGLQTGALRRLTQDPARAIPVLMRLSALVIVSGALVVVFLVLVKPF